jgi:hypothetical protein
MKTNHTPEFAPHKPGEPMSVGPQSDIMIGFPGKRRFVGTVPNTDLAAELVRRWNAHAELLEALKRIAESEPRPKRNGDYDQADVAALQRTARIALAKATQ